jgi:hypothetical protein
MQKTSPSPKDFTLDSNKQANLHPMKEGYAKTKRRRRETPRQGV